MDALKLNLRAKDQLHPFLTELMSGYSRFKGSQEWEGRAKILHWYVVPHVFFARANDRLITLNALKASDEITEEQSRQVCTPPENDDGLMCRCCLILKMHIMSSSARWEERISEPIRWVVHLEETKMHDITTTSSLRVGHGQ
jgi:hypothetical protein